ncbi:hypothetical protein GCM10027074_77980 [Streptomyces deserti]
MEPLNVRAALRRAVTITHRQRDPACTGRGQREARLFEAACGNRARRLRGTIAGSAALFSAFLGARLQGAGVVTGDPAHECVVGCRPRRAVLVRCAGLRFTTRALRPA